MKNRNKFLNLANGMAFLAINNGALLFTALATYGLMMIRDFTIKQFDNKMKAQTEGLIALNVIRAAVEFFGSTAELIIIPYLVIFLNVLVFIMTFLVLKSSIGYLIKELKNYDLENLVSKVGRSFYIIIATEGILITFLLLILIASFLPIPLLINAVSMILTPTFALATNIGATIIKYLASRSFTRAGLLLDNAENI